MMFNQFHAWFQIIDALKSVVKILAGPVFTFVVTCPYESVSAYIENVKKAMPHVVVSAWLMVWTKLNNPSGTELTCQPGPRHCNSTECMVVFDCLVPNNVHGTKMQNVKAESFFRYQKVVPAYPGHVLASLRRVHFDGKITDGDLLLDGKNVPINKSQKPRDFTAALVRDLDSRLCTMHSCMTDYMMCITVCA